MNIYIELNKMMYFSNLIEFIILQLYTPSQRVFQTFVFFYKTSIYLRPHFPKICVCMGLANLCNVQLSHG